MLRSLIVILFMWLSCCSSGNNQSYHESSNNLEFGIGERVPGESQIIKFQRNGIMDTITATIEGRVIDSETEEGVSNAVVVLEGPELFYYASTDSSGNFKLPHIKAKRYKVVIDHGTYKSTSKVELQVNSGNIFELVAEMAKAAEK